MPKFSGGINAYKGVTGAGGARTTPVEVLIIGSENTNNQEYAGFGQKIIFKGGTYNNTTYRTLAEIIHAINDDSINTTRGTSLDIRLLNSATGTVPVSRLFIDYRGYVGIDTVPTEKLDVNGNINTGVSNKVTTGTLELGHASDTTISRVSGGRIAVEGVNVPTISSTDTLTNKRITKRGVSTTVSGKELKDYINKQQADDATAVIDTDTTDIYELHSMTSTTAISTTGTPSFGDTLMIKLRGSGASRGLTWDSIFQPIGITLPTSAPDGKWVYVTCIYNTRDSKWDAIHTVTQA